MLTAINDGSEIIAQCNLLERRVARTVARRALREVMRPLLVAAKELAPKDTGSLAASLRLGSFNPKRSTLGVSVFTKGELAKSKVARGLNPFWGLHFYGSFVHWGHYFGKRGRNVNIGWKFGKRAKKSQLSAKRAAIAKYNASRRRFPGIPFLKEAGDQVRAQMDADFRKRIEEGVQQALADGKGK